MEQISYQEQILETLLNLPEDTEYPHGLVITAVKDCFAASRLSSRLDELYQHVPFNNYIKNEYNKTQDDLNNILKKYRIKPR